MTTTNRSRVHVDAKVTAEFGVGELADLDILAIGSRSLPMACSLCHYVGPFKTVIVTRGKTYIEREYQCPACLCTVTVRIRV